MPKDPDAALITLRYTGGSMSLPVGNAKDIFGESNDLLKQEPVAVSNDVPGHSRVRVIGSPPVQVIAHSRTFNQWPTSQASLAAAGRKVYATWQGSAGEWTIRYTGSAAALGDFLNANAAKAIQFTTSRGTKYGPFAGAIIDGN